MNHRRRLFHLLAASAAALLVTTSIAPAKTPDGKPLILLLAGKQSHGPGEHEHNAGVQLLAKCLSQGAPNVATKVHLNAEWPSQEELSQADTILLYADGGGGHFLLKGDNLAQAEAQMKRGCGFVCLHYAVEYPSDKGGPQALDWMGGFFEANWSVNPHWTANFKEFPKHPISNGVKPFSINDEWYFHMRFREDAGKLTHILTDVPPESTMSRKDGPHSGNPTVRAAVAAKKPQTVAWAYERPNGGRGFGFTGGHFHKGWGNDDQRKLVLNAILWTAKVDVPSNGVESKVTPEDLSANLDPKGQPKPKQSAAPLPGSAKPVFATGTVARGPVPVKAEIKGAKQLHLVVTEAGDGYGCDWADWLSPVLIKADGTKQKLTELKWKAASAGHGKARIGANCNGKPLLVRGEERTDSIGTHAPSVITYDLPEGVVAFEAEGAIDDGGFSQGCGSTVTFEIYTGQAPVLAATSPQGGAAGPGGADRYSLDKAKANMATFTTAPGLKAGLFAAEPMIQNPTSIDIDHRGRVWAVECVNYRKYANLRPDGDRVVILEDSNGDGEADTSKTFFQSPELTNPLGVCVLPQPKGTKVIVSAAPNVWLLTDEDGDDVAEKSVIIFKTTGVWNYDHQIHKFVFGPDGRFYFNFGDAATSLTWPDGTVVTDLAGNAITNKGQPYRKGMVFRCDIDLTTGKASNVETLGHNFRNNYAATIDSFGTIWQSDNDDDGNKGVRINYVMEFGNYGYTDEFTGAGWKSQRINMEKEVPKQHWYQNDPGVVPNLIETGAGSPTGITVNEGKGLGAAFENQIIHCDAGPRTTRAYPVEKDGAGYKATMVDVLTSTDSWYRASDLSVAPDGALLISDWYDPGVGGHAMGDHDPGRIMGRVYRVSVPNLSKPAAPDFSTAEGAARALQSPNRATQYMAWTALKKMGAAAESALQSLWKGTNTRLRGRALGLLSQIEGSEAKYLTAGLSDADEDIRIFAVRLTVLAAKTRGFDTEPIEAQKDLLRALFKDTPAVRRQIAVSLRGAKKIEKLWAALASQHDGKDRWYLEALGIGAAGAEDECLDAWLAMVGENWNTPAGRDILWRLRSARAADYLAKIVENPSLGPAERPRYLRSFDFLPKSPERTKALVQLATAGRVADDIAREALVRLKGTDVSGTPEVANALKAAIEKARGTPQFVELVRDFGLKGQGTALLNTAIKLRSEAIAADAVRLLLSEPDADQVINAALSSGRAADTLALLGSTATTRGLERLTSLVRDTKQTPELRRDAVRALARTQTGAETLLRLAQNGQFPEDLRLVAASALAQVQYAKLKDPIAQQFPLPNALGGQPLPPIAELAKLKGDVAKGRAVFERAESACLTCHKVGDKGMDFGPALSEIGTKLPKEAIYESIINPNAGVSMGFETWQFTTKEGGGAMGVLRSETAEEVVVGLPGGATTKMPKSNLSKREKLPNSMMPSGLNQALSKDDLVDLVEYLASLKKQ